MNELDPQSQSNFELRFWLITIGFFLSLYSLWNFADFMVKPPFAPKENGNERPQVGKKFCHPSFIDCLAARGDLDHGAMAQFLNVNKRSFNIIKDELMASTVQDNLNKLIHNQIYFVLACIF